MKITCQSCQSKYNVADEKVQGKIVKIRCRKCGSTIVVQGNGGATANGSSGGSAGDADGVQWHVNVGDAEPRTMTLAELVDAYNAGTVAQDTFIWTDGMDDWKPLSEVEAVVSALHVGADGGASAPAAAEPAYRAPAASVDDAAPAAYAAPQAAPEPRRAAVKREARARDLFGTGVAAEEVQTSAPAVPQMMSSSAVDDANKMTGQRNENSVLFSLAVLTKDADDRAPEDVAPKATSRNTEDSGLIDLKALAAKAESMRPAGLTESNAFASPLGLGSAPLGGQMSVLGGPLGEAPQKSKLPLIIGGGAGIALLLVLGIVIGVKLAGSSTPGPEASATASAAPTVTASAEPTATASAEASAAAPAPSASVAVKPKTGGGVYHPPSGGAAKPAGGGTAGAGTAAAGGTPPPTPPPPKKAGSDCGCNGDLMCLMKCSTH
jgi:predicted Zn finger-like uncharacterized protein